MTLNEELDLMISKVENIPATKRYWLVRTQSGSLYETFRENNIVALGHTEVTVFQLDEYNKASAGNDNLLRTLIKKKVIEEYEKKISETNIEEETVDLRKSTLIANQIFKFAFEIKKGDVIIIPSYNSDLVTFGEVQESYIGNFSPEELRRIDTEAILKKRVKWIKDISRRDLDPYLYRMFTAHHAVIDVGGYAEIIERSLKDFFVLDNEAHVIINIQTEEEIPAAVLFGLGTDLLQLIDKFAKDYDLDISSKDLQVSISLNSPGKIDLKSRIKKVTLVAGLILVAFGGGYKNKYVGDVETNGIPGLIKAIDQFRDHEEQRNMRARIFETYKDSLKVKDADDMNNLIKQFSDNKDIPK